MKKVYYFLFSLVAVLTFGAVVRLKATSLAKDCWEISLSNWLKVL